ncbi:hypothetical protein ACFP2T_27130 [Plantactinospora solaniradicis]|uniref:Helix-turn-helix domain-containing protein n=1 Tax=Plantactinospora solaniradicis TaxID=1723736 RepID=A0ABW1KGC0_9ACTN
MRNHRAAELAVQRARYEADRAERAFTNVDPDNRLVARSLESRGETKLAQLADAEAALATAQVTTAPAPEQNALRALAADLPRLRDSPTTSHRDRKRLLRSLIADITLLPAVDDDSVRIGVRWHTGATDELTALRHGPGRTPAGALELVRRYGATHTSEQLAERLNATGLLAGKGKPFTAGAVARVRDAYKIWAPRTVAIQDGEVSVKHTAAQLGIPASAVYNWLVKGQVSARRAPGGRWCIPGTPQRRRSTGTKSPSRSASSRPTSLPTGTPDRTRLTMTITADRVMTW